MNVDLISNHTVTWSNKMKDSWQSQRLHNPLPECLTVWVLPDCPALSTLDNGDCLAAVRSSWFRYVSQPVLVAVASWCCLNWTHCRTGFGVWWLFQIHPNISVMLLVALFCLFWVILYLTLLCTFTYSCSWIMLKKIIRHTQYLYGETHQVVYRV